MNLYESSAYGRRYGFVYLRYVAIFFFFISQLAMYYVILNLLQSANNALDALQTLDAVSIVESLASFGVKGSFGVVLNIMRNLGCLVIPLYFIATVALVLNLNRRDIVTITERTALLAILLFILEFLIYAVILGTVTVLVDELFKTIQSQYSDVIGVINEIIETLNGETSVLPVGSAEEAIGIAQNYITMKLVVIITKYMPSLNIFLDQLLCLLMCIFFCTHPKRIKSKAGLVIFRLAGLIPVAYIVSAFVISALVQTGEMTPNLLLLCLFPTKKMPHFLFIGCLLMCNRMFPMRTLGKASGLTDVYVPPKKVFRATPLVFETKVAARRRSLITAVFLSVCLIILCAVDYCLGRFPLLAKWGLGKSYYSVFCIPFLFLFDGRKPTKKRDYRLFSFAYFLAVVVIVVIYLFY